MLIHKTALACRHASSKDETRYNLTGIYLEPGSEPGTVRTVATDGHMLVMLDTPTPDPSDMPGEGGKADTEPLKPFILPADGVERVRKAIPGKRDVARLPILGHAALDVADANANGRATFTTTDLEQTQRVECRKIDGEYPNYRQVIPDGSKTVVSFGINLALLERVYKACREFSPDAKAPGMVKVEVVDELSPIRITRTDPDRGEMVAVVMPARLG